MAIFDSYFDITRGYLGYSPTAGASRGASSASSDFSAWKALGTYPGVVAPPLVGNDGYIECPNLV